MLLRHLRLVLGALARPNRADHGGGLSGGIELRQRGRRIILVHDHHHADAAVEGAVHFLR